MAGVYGSGSGERGDESDVCSDESGAIRWFRYVTHDKIIEFERKGWIIVSALGPPHGSYSVLMEYVDEHGHKRKIPDGEASLQAD